MADSKITPPLPERLVGEFSCPLGWTLVESPGRAEIRSPGAYWFIVAVFGTLLTLFAVLWWYGKLPLWFLLLAPFPAVVIGAIFWALFADQEARGPWLVWDAAKRAIELPHSKSLVPVADAKRLLVAYHWVEGSEGSTPMAALYLEAANEQRELVPYAIAWSNAHRTVEGTATRLAELTGLPLDFDDRAVEDCWWWNLWGKRRTD